MKNSKGFTLVELLATIVILGIITGLSFPALRTIKEKSNKTKYETYQKALISSAKLYINSYEEDIFGNNASGCAYVTLDKMKEKQLAKDIGVDDISCDSENTFVKIIKFKGNYIYKAFLGCGEINSEGVIEKVNIIYPESSTPYEEDPNLCKGGDATTNISIYASPNSGELYRKNYNVRLSIQSITGINKNSKVYYSWTHDNNPSSITELTELDFKFPENQTNEIELGNDITSTSTELEMPNNADGIYYLIIKVENLYDLSGEVWSAPDGNRNYIKFGPYYIDNQGPTFDETTITSNSTEYNTINPVLNLNINDNHTPKDKIKICIRVDGQGCNTNDYYNNTQKVTVPQIDKYSGQKHEIYIYALDEAHTISERKITYQVPKGYTIYYDTSGGTECETKFIIDNFEKKARLGELCNPSKLGYTFKGWYNKRKKVNSNTKIDKDILLRAEWSKKST